MATNPGTSGTDNPSGGSGSTPPRGVQGGASEAASTVGVCRRVRQCYKAVGG